MILDKDTCGVMRPVDVQKMNLTYAELAELKKKYHALQLKMHYSNLATQEYKRTILELKYQSSLQDSSSEAKTNVIIFQDKKISSLEKRLKFDGWIFKGIGLVAVLAGAKYTFTH